LSEIYEVLSAHYNMNHLSNKPFSFLPSLIYKAIEKREEKKAWDMWIARYPHMDEKTFVPFNEFYRKITMKISKRPSSDILNEAIEIHKKRKGGK